LRRNDIVCLGWLYTLVLIEIQLNGEKMFEAEERGTRSGLCLRFVYIH